MTIATLNDLNRLDVTALRAADVVVAAASVLRSDLYFDRLARLAGTPALFGRLTFLAQPLSLLLAAAGL